MPTPVGQRCVERRRELHRPADEEEAEEEARSDPEDAVRLLATCEPREEDERVEQADRAHADADDQCSRNELGPVSDPMREQKPGQEEPEKRQPGGVDREVESDV